MNIQLTVNYLPFCLGEPVDREKFAEAELKKLGVLGKAAALAAPWAPIYWAARPAVSCFLSLESIRQQSNAFNRGEQAAVFTATNHEALSVYFYCWRRALQIVKIVELKRLGRNVDVFVDLLSRASIEHLGRQHLRILG